MSSIFSLCSSPRKVSLAPLVRVTNNLLTELRNNCIPPEGLINKLEDYFLTKSLTSFTLDELLTLFSRSSLYDRAFDELRESLAEILKNIEPSDDQPFIPTNYDVNYSLIGDFSNYKLRMIAFAQLALKYDLKHVFLDFLVVAVKFNTPLTLDAILLDIIINAPIFPERLAMIQRLIQLGMHPSAHHWVRAVKGEWTDVLEGFLTSDVECPSMALCSALDLLHDKAAHSKDYQWINSVAIKMAKKEARCSLKSLISLCGICGEAQLDPEIHRLLELIFAQDLQVDKIIQRRTPLQVAVDAGFVKAVELLLKAGANANVRERGKNLIDIAIESQKKEIVLLLHKHGAKIEKNIYAYETSDEIRDLLIELVE